MTCSRYGNHSSEFRRQNSLSNRSLFRVSGSFVDALWQSFLWVSTTKFPVEQEPFSSLRELRWCFSIATLPDNERELELSCVQRTNIMHEIRQEFTERSLEPRFIGIKVHQSRTVSGGHWLLSRSRNIFYYSFMAMNRISWISKLQITLQMSMRDILGCRRDSPRCQHLHKMIVFTCSDCFLDCAEYLEYSSPSNLSINDPSLLSSFS